MKPARAAYAASKERIMNEFKEAAKLLKVHEGWRDKVYRCSADKLTIGYGFNLDDNPLPKHIGEQLLEHKMNDCLRCLRKYEWYDTLDLVRRVVVIDMMYNLGPIRFSQFKKFIAALKDEDYNKAALEMEDSRWYNQVGIRARRLVRMMKTGEMPTDV